MATVPVQQTPTEQIDTGGVPLFSATNIQPVQDTGVAQDIGRLSNAQKQFAKIAADLQDQTDDVKSNEAYRGYQKEADVKVNEYLNLQRGDAIATVDYDKDTNKPITRYDQLVNDLTEISNKYLETLDNKSQKRIFNDKYSASKRISVNSASKHSLKQTRLKLTEESKSNVNLAKTAAVDSFESFQEQGGDYEINLFRGHLEIKRNAELNGRNTDINKGPLSSKYLEDVQTYNKEVMEGVIDRLAKLPGGHALVKEYVLMHKPEEIKDVVTELEISIAEKHDDYNKEQCVNGVLTNNGNQNTGSFLDQTAKLMCLKSNHYVNDGNGASVHDGNHSNEINIAGQTQENNIDTLEKIRNESKFYKLDSNATLINEHQTTHLFAVQHLGVQKADSLYTKAKSLYPIDQRAYKENPKYAKAINKKIIENYNKLINEEANKKYKGDYVTAIANDLEIIENGINYDGEFTSKVDFITGLRPLEVLKEEIKATITDPKQQKFALEDLEIKYKKIKNQRTQIYNEGLNAAKEIAFAEEGGWKNLEANGIKIENFSESDQALLKKGQPIESNVDTVAQLIDNPKEVRDNLNSYSHELSQSDYLGLKNYANSLKSESKYVEATGNVTMLKATLNRFDMGDLISSKNKNKKKKYVAIHEAWLKEINARQVANNNTKLTMGQKQDALNTVLLDTVNIDNDPFLGFIGGGDTKDTNIFFVDQDKQQDVYVDIPYKDENVRVFTSKIDPDVLALIQESLRKANKPVTQKTIADYFVRKGQPKNVNEAFAYKEEE
tara:strand:+ start:3218 stop:5557 length:2340 start_codon:yes stop_codon:yes gene_type:complete